MGVCRTTSSWHGAIPGSPHTSGGMPYPTKFVIFRAMLAPHRWGYADYLHQGLQAAQDRPVPAGVYLSIIQFVQWDFPELAP